MTCRQFAEFLAAYLAGELPPETVRRFEEHLRVCPNCGAYLSNYADAVKLGRMAFADPDADLPAEVPADLVKAILASRRR